MSRNDLYHSHCGLLFSRLCSEAGFSLIEVMIAAGLFFMATFAILILVSATLRNARALQRSDVDAGMAASQVCQLLKTNRQIEISGSGDFGEAYPDYSFKFTSSEYRSNGLLRVQIVVNRRGSISPIDTATIWVYDPAPNRSPTNPIYVEDLSLEPSVREKPQKLGLDESDSTNALAAG